MSLEEGASAAPSFLWQWRWTLFLHLLNLQTLTNGM